MLKKKISFGMVWMLYFFPNLGVAADEKKDIPVVFSCSFNRLLHDNDFNYNSCGNSNNLGSFNSDIKYLDALKYFIASQSFDKVDSFRSNGNSIVLCYLKKSSQLKLTYVIKRSSKNDVVGMLDILEFFRQKKIETGINPPLSLVLPEEFVSLKQGFSCIVYHAARETSLHDYIMKNCSQHENIANIMKRIGKCLYKFHDYLRPNNSELDDIMSDPSKQKLRYYFDSGFDIKPREYPMIFNDPYLAKILLSVNHGDLHPGNIFVNNQENIFFIDYLSMVRDLPLRNGFSSARDWPFRKGFSFVTNDIAYFVAYMFGYQRQVYRDALGRGFLLESMVHFLLGYMSNIPEKYHVVFLLRVFDNYCFLLDELMVQSELLRGFLKEIFQEFICVKTLRKLKKNIKETQQKVVKVWKNYKRPPLVGSHPHDNTMISGDAVPAASCEGY